MSYYFNNYHLSRTATFVLGLFGLVAIVLGITAVWLDGDIQGKLALTAAILGAISFILGPPAGMWASDSWRKPEKPVKSGAKY